MNSILEFKPAISISEEEHRLTRVLDQVWSRTDPDFDDVTRLIYQAPAGYYTVDPFPVYDGRNWHLFYVTGQMRYCDDFVAALAAGDYQKAHETPYEDGEGHAVGRTLFDLEFHSRIFTEPQGDFALGLQGDSSIVRHEGRWVNLYSVRGLQGNGLCLAYSDDLYEWEFERANPVVWPPDWAVRPGKFGHAWIVPDEGRYLIYSMAGHKNGMAAIALLSTEDFRHFHDHGPVMLMPRQLRGTTFIEAPTVVYREGMWHLFMNIGEGVWHTLSSRPDSFMQLRPDDSQPWRRANQITPMTYFAGRFHAQRVFQDPVTLKWFMVTTRKEYQRYLNRRQGVLTPRGSQADESALEQGIFLSEIDWDGDLPVLHKPQPA